MPCLNEGHFHEWPTTGTLFIERCEKFCAFCTGEKANKLWSYAWFLRRHVRDKHIKSGEYPDLIVADAWEMPQQAGRKTSNKREEAKNEVKLEFVSRPCLHAQAGEAQPGESESPSELGSSDGTGSNGGAGGVGSSGGGLGGSGSGIGSGSGGLGGSIGSDTTLDDITPWTALDNMVDVTNFGTGYVNNSFPPGLGAVNPFNPYALLPTLVGNEIFSLAVEPQDTNTARAVLTALQNIGEQAKGAALKPAEILFIIRVFAETVGNEMFSM